MRVSVLVDRSAGFRIGGQAPVKNRAAGRARFTSLKLSSAREWLRQQHRYLARAAPSVFAASPARAPRGTSLRHFPHLRHRPALPDSRTGCCVRSTAAPAWCTAARRQGRHDAVLNGARPQQTGIHEQWRDYRSRNAGIDHFRYGEAHHKTDRVQESYRENEATQGTIGAHLQTQHCRSIHSGGDASVMRRCARAHLRNAPIVACDAATAACALARARRVRWPLQPAFPGSPHCGNSPDDPY